MYIKMLANMQNRCQDYKYYMQNDDDDAKMLTETTSLKFWLTTF